MTQRWLTRSAVREALVVWALGFSGILIAWLVYRPAAKLVATVGFLYLPVLAMSVRGEDYRDFGLSTRRLKADVVQFLSVSAVVFPLFIAGYVAFINLLPHLPGQLVQLLTPYMGTPRFSPRLPDRFLEWVIDQTFVVALPEEFFYRGYLQTRLRDAWPQGRLFFGARLGPAFWLTALLFALGHLAIFEVWRLAVFFPALIFAWMRERSGSVVGAALFHAAANLLVQVLDASFFNR
ncbi:MAG: CPBP family intramembrane metalloprotease [Archangium sp.]|nr:CPBP family intramembrane metalloprotease [Archangium sp.]